MLQLQCAVPAPQNVWACSKPTKVCASYLLLLLLLSPLRSLPAFSCTESTIQYHCLLWPTEHSSSVSLMFFQGTDVWCRCVLCCCNSRELSGHKSRELQQHNTPLHQISSTRRKHGDTLEVLQADCVVVLLFHMGQVLHVINHNRNNMTMLSGMIDSRSRLVRRCGVGGAAVCFMLCQLLLSSRTSPVPPYREHEDTSLSVALVVTIKSLLLIISES